MALVRVYCLVIPFRTLGIFGLPGLPGEKFECFSILQILRRRRRITGVDPYCPYRAMLAGSLGSELSEASPVRSCYAANLVHYCIERYLALALVYPGIVAVVLPWYCLPQHPSLAG